MRKKKDAVRDQYGQRVLIETIAAYKHDGISIYIDLRSGGDTVRLAWPTKAKSTEVVNTIDKFFNFI